MDSINDIKAAFNKQIREKTILSITDYDAENIYVIAAIPTKRLKEKVGWLDGLYSMDKKSLQITGSFMPIEHENFSSLPDSAVIYEYKEAFE